MRIPAAFNGVVGYKTSTGRIDATGLVALARSYDTIGPLARSVEDCILLDMRCAARCTVPSGGAPSASLTVVVPDERRLDDGRAGGGRQFRASLAGAAQAGVTVRRERVGALDEVLEMNGAARHADRGRGLHRIQRHRRQRAGRPGRPPRRRAHHGRQEDVGARRAFDPARAPATHPELHAQLAGALLVMPTTTDHRARGGAAGRRRRAVPRASICGAAATPRSAMFSTFAPWRCRTAATASGLPTSFLLLGRQRRGRAAARLCAGGRAGDSRQQRCRHVSGNGETA